MNWLKKTLDFGQKIKRLLKKRPSREDMEESDWTSCCKGPILKKDLENNLWVCPDCNKHHRINPKQRFDILFGMNNYQIFSTPMPPDDPLDFTDSKSYKDRLKSARKKTGLDCSMVVADGSINNIKLTAIASDFNYMGASIGAAEGEAFLFAAQHSIENNQPLLVVATGGGMKMQESIISLNQMTRTTLAINELKAKKIPYIVLFSDPVAGGITASYAMLGDIQIAEPGALIAFAGRRVIEGTVKEELPENFQKSEHVQDCGFVDAIIHRKDLPEKIGILLSILLKKQSEVKMDDNDKTSKNNIENREAS
tara:strand:- start:172 stop:1101 length:930 start_codon:yes stop_codon:yes gene_type:complete